MYQRNSNRSVLNYCIHVTTECILHCHNCIALNPKTNMLLFWINILNKQRTELCGNGLTIYFQSHFSRNVPIFKTTFFSGDTRIIFRRTVPPDETMLLKSLEKARDTWLNRRSGEFCELLNGVRLGMTSSTPWGSLERCPPISKVTAIHKV